MRHTRRRRWRPAAHEQGHRVPQRPTPAGASLRGPRLIARALALRADLAPRPRARDPASSASLRRARRRRERGLFEEGCRRSAYGDPAGSPEHSHRGDLDHLEAPLLGRPEHRIDDAPIRVLGDEDGPGLPAADRLDRLVRAHGPPRCRPETFNVHDHCCADRAPGRTRAEACPHPTRLVYQRPVVVSTTGRARQSGVDGARPVPGGHVLSAPAGAVVWHAGPGRERAPRGASSRASPPGSVAGRTATLPATTGLPPPP